MDALSLSDTVHGMPWREVFALRDRLAWRWYDRMGGLVPLAEWHSVGNLAITHAVQGYDPSQGVPFGAYLRQRVTRLMTNLWRDSSAPRRGTAGPHRLTLCQMVAVSPDSALLDGTVPSLDAQVQARQRLGQTQRRLATVAEPLRTTYLRWCLGWSQAALAVDLGLSQPALSARLAQVRQTLIGRE